MSNSNRELVIDFVSYKLSQKGYSWSQLEEEEEEDEHRTDLPPEEPETGGVLNGSPSWHPHVVNGAPAHRSGPEPARGGVPGSRVRQALREAGDEFELRYRRAFSDLTSQLHITLGTAYQSFEQVVNELFRDGVNWGRIVAFFSFGGALCVESVDKEMRVLVGRIVSWMTTYLTDHLDPWIQENGGWEMTQPVSYDRVQLGFHPVLLIQPSQWGRLGSQTWILSSSEILLAPSCCPGVPHKLPSAPLLSSPSLQPQDPRALLVPAFWAV